MDEAAEDSECDYKSQQSSDDGASADTDLESNWIWRKLLLIDSRSYDGFGFQEGLRPLIIDKFALKHLILVTY